MKFIKFVAIGFMFLSQWVFAGGVLKLAADPWCPFTCEAKSDNPGVMIEALQMALEPMGYKLEYEQMPWSEAIERTRAGKIHGVVGAARHEIPDFIYLKRGLVASQSCFFVLNSSVWRYKGVNSLKALAGLGVAAGYAYGEPFDSQAKGLKNLKSVSGVNVSEQLFKMLLSARVEAVMEEKYVASYVMKSLPSSQNIKRVDCLKTEDLYVAFSPKFSEAQKLSEEISTRVKELQLSSKWSELLRKYGL